MSDLLSIGASGISAYRTALAAISDNVANSETPGFARRSTAQREQVTSLPMLPTYRGGMVFGGTQITAITRAYDQFRDQEVRASSAEAGRADARARWLLTTENALDDSDTGIGTRLTAFYNAADALAADPDNGMTRRAFISALDDAAAAFRTTARDLADAATGISKEAQGTVDSLNANLEALAKLNLAILRSENGSAAQASLLDQRDKLVDQISTTVNLDTYIEGDGTVTLKLAGNSDSLLLQGVRSYPVSIGQTGNGQLTLYGTLGDGSGPIALPGGAIGGLIDMSTIVADRRHTLNGIAADFATTVNTWSAGGVDRNGNPGQSLLNISATTGALSLAIAIGLTDADAVPAASTDGATMTANGNLLALQGLRAGGAEDRMAALIAGHSQATAAARTEADVTATRRDGALASRDAVTGVDLDREAAELLRFQQAYNGSAKILQVARETLQSILDLF